MAVGVALMIAAFGGAVIGRPFVPLALYLTIFFIYPTSNYGSLEASSTAIYFRGSGQLFFPALLWGLLLTVLWTWIGRAFDASAVQKERDIPKILFWFIGWLILLMLHAVWGLMIGKEAKDVLGMHGFSNLPWMGLLILLLFWSGRTEATLFACGRLFILAALAKSLFGLVRFAFFGGDSSNVYQNLMGIKIKLTFFDIGDGLVCLLGLVVAISLLAVRREERRNKLWDVIYSVTAVLALACITLSFRRTAWIGLMLVAVFLLFKMRPMMRWSVALAGVPILLTGLFYAAVMRIGQTRGADGLSAFFYDLVSKRFGAESHRVLELRLAWESFSSSPLLGIGSWGRYASSDLIPWQNPTTAGSFLHSGILHVAMKAGMPGLVLLAGVIFAFIVFVRRLPRDLPAMAEALVLAGCAGLLFMLPDMLIGTPIPQLRTTQLLALCLGLPYFVASALSKKSNLVPKLSSRTLRFQPRVA